MRALSIKQPWVWAILNAGKDVENRTWTSKHRGWLALHASGRESSGLAILHRVRCTYRDTLLCVRSEQPGKCEILSAMRSVRNPAAAQHISRSGYAVSGNERFIRIDSSCQAIFEESDQPGSGYWEL